MNGYLTLQKFIEYCHGGRKIKISEEDLTLVREARTDFERIINSGSEKIYGVHTGVGKLVEKEVSLNPEGQERFQKNIIKSHACGIGSYLSLEESRGVLLLLINMLRRGKSAASEELLLKLVEMFNEDKIPAIPAKGSLGASGDLIPLAHLALNLLGEGKFYWRGRLLSFDYTLKNNSFKLRSGEALSLINGTHFMTSILAHTLYRARILAETADIIAAMTISGLGGKTCPFNGELCRLKPHPGTMKSAEVLRRLLGDGCCSGGLLQDPYSLRCTPQVHGVAREEVERGKVIIEREMNSITCNPIINFGEIFRGGNFHGQSLAELADSLSVAISTLANISERRTNQLFESDNLPDFLIEKSGLNTGLMICQYLAAALVSENKTLAHPASIDSISVACGQEDFVSMGGWAVRKLKEICQNTVNVLAIELFCAAQALDFSGLPSDSKIAKLRAAVRAKVSHVKKDRIYAKDVKILFYFIYSGDFLKEARKIM